MFDMCVFVEFVCDSLCMMFFCDMILMFSFDYDFCVYCKILKCY